MTFDGQTHAESDTLSFDGQTRIRMIDRQTHGNGYVIDVRRTDTLINTPNYRMIDGQTCGLIIVRRTDT